MFIINDPNGIKGPFLDINFGRRLIYLLGYFFLCQFLNAVSLSKGAGLFSLFASFVFALLSIPAHPFIYFLYKRGNYIPESVEAQIYIFSNTIIICIILFIFPLIYKLFKKFNNKINKWENELNSFKNDK